MDQLLFEFLTLQTGPLDYEHIFLSPNNILTVRWLCYFTGTRPRFNQCPLLILFSSKQTSGEKGAAKGGQEGVNQNC